MRHYRLFLSLILAVSLSVQASAANIMECDNIAEDSNTSK